VPVLHKLTGIKKGEVVESEESRGDYLLLIREILTHVVKHPDAKDTADGIHKFWLSSKTVHQSSDKVREVLEYLVEKKGWLTKKVSGASVTLYGLNKNRVHEVEGFLQQVRTDD
jgi:NADH:ubiquinone oxidoreductase subunit E